LAYKIQIDKQNCQGHARCANRSPDLFKLNADGYIDSEGFDVPEGKEMDAFNAAVSCPERIITLLDEQGEPVKNRNALQAALDGKG
jgi:ferredoxin